MKVTVVVFHFTEFFLGYFFSVYFKFARTSPDLDCENFVVRDYLCRSYIAGFPKCVSRNAGT